MNAQMLKDLKESGCGYPALFFYLWLNQRFGEKEFTREKAEKEYEASERSVFRYLSELVKHDMVEKSEPDMYKNVTYKIVSI